MIKFEFYMRANWLISHKHPHGNNTSPINAKMPIASIVTNSNFILNKILNNIKFPIKYINIEALSNT